jgi:hypothetical protein
MKKFSIFMSFVAIIAASLVFIFVAASNKEHKNDIPAETKTTPVLVRASPRIEVSEPRNSHVVGLPKLVEPLTSPPLVNTFTPPIGQTNSSINIGPPNLTQVPQQVAEPIYGPNSAVIFAVGDMLTMPKEIQPYIRYISLYNIPKAKRKEYAATLSFVVNSLSTRRRMYIPEFVGASDETLIRLNTANYEWTPEAWEKLGLKGSGVHPQPEPYFHMFIDQPIFEKVKVKKKITEKVPWMDERGVQYVNKDNSKAFKNVEKEIEVEEVISNKRKFIVDYKAPWLDPLGVKTLVEYTGSEFPIYRLDWFISNVILPPVYYDFLKLGNKGEDFDKLIFADEKLAAKARSQDKAVVVASIVARNNRTLNRSPTFTGGYYWKSHDSLKSTDDRNYIQFILDEKFDATEDIGTLPNGLQAYFLTDGQDKRIDFANSDIAIDNGAIDRVVRTGRSCMICHADGIRPINDEVRALTNKIRNPRELKLLVTRKEDFYRIEDLFGSDLDKQIIADQNLYRDAVSRATGLQSETISRTLNEIYNNYIENLLTAAEISRDIGVEFNQLDGYIKASKDNLVLGLLKTPIRPIRRDQWEQSFQRFMIMIMARKQGLDHADQFPPGPLIPLPKP